MDWRFVIPLFLASCGIPVNVQGTAHLEVDVKLDTVTAYFEAYCKEKYPDDLPAQTECINIELAKFLKLLEGNK